MTPTSTKPTWSREVNQSLLGRFGFTGRAGDGNFSGEKFLDTLPLAQQYEYTQTRRGYAGHENYTRASLRELENNLFQQFFNPTPTKNATNDAITDTAVTQAARKGRKSTIVSDFQSLETPTNTQRKTLLGQ